MLGLDYDVVVELYKAACFTLPTFFPEPLCAVINPINRYCIDLQKEGVRWDRKREMRRAVGDFRLTLSHQVSRHAESSGDTATFQDPPVAFTM
jgi:hypothetical protein